MLRATQHFAKAICKFCGCSEDKACNVEGSPCYWVVKFGMTRFDGDQATLLDLDDSICSSPDCIAQAYREGVKQLPKN